MIETSDSIKNISAALLKFQGLVEGVKRDGANPHFKSRYATLENVIDTARPALQKVGVMFTQAPGALIEGAIEVATMLIHPESGEWMRCTMQIPLAKRDPQGAGSAQTYSMRYSLMAMLGLPPTDDDGEAAMDRSSPPLRDGLSHNKQTGRTSAYSLKKDKSPDNWDAFLQELGECETTSRLTSLALAWSSISTRDNWPSAWHNLAKEKINQRREELINGIVPDEQSDFPGDANYVPREQNVLGAG